MFNLKTLTIGAIVASVATSAISQTQITGSVQSKCSVHTDTQGVYVNSSPNILSTAATGGGVAPRVRFDVALANNYKAHVSWPYAFSSSPALSDAVAWAGSVEVGQVSDPLMSAYETSKVVYNNTSVYDLTIAGSTWFKVESTATYGYEKSLPGGNYTAIVLAECIAK